MSKPSSVRKTKDLDLIRSLNDSLIGEPLTTSDFRDSHWWISTYRGFLSGFCGLKVGSYGGYLIRAAVLPEWRGRGIHRDLLRARIRYARRIKLPLLISYTLHHNHPSSNNLAAAGFKLYDPEEPWCEEPDALYWMLKL